MEASPSPVPTSRHGHLSKRSGSPSRTSELHLGEFAYAHAGAQGCVLGGVHVRAPHDMVRCAAAHRGFMPRYVHSCPSCDRTASDIGMFGSYFDVYACDKCETRYCYGCRGSNNGRRCPECGCEKSSTWGRVSKG